MYNIKEQYNPVATTPLYNNGVVIGKFMPFQLGHEILIKFAKTQVQNLYVLVDNVPNELLTSAQRAKIIQDKFPDINVGYFSEKMPQEPGEHPQFWDIWSTAIKDNVNILYNKKIVKLKELFDAHFSYENLRENKPEDVKIDALIASMEYGFELSQHLKTKFIPIDIEREIINISATKIRNEPQNNVYLMSEKTKPFFTKKIAFIGAESTFKSSIAKEVRNILHNNPEPALYVPEFAKNHLKFNAGVFKEEDVAHIINAQNNLMNVACEYSGGYAICDSDALTTKIYAQAIFNKMKNKFPETLENIVKEQKFHLTFLFKPDANTPFVEDVHRKCFDIKDNDNRINIFDAMERELKLLGRHYIVITGTYPERLSKVLKHIRNNITSLIHN